MVSHTWSDLDSEPEMLGSIFSLENDFYLNHLYARSSRVWLLVSCLSISWQAKETRTALLCESGGSESSISLSSALHCIESNVNYIQVTNRIKQDFDFLNRILYFAMFWPSILGHLLHPPRCRGGLASSWTSAYRLVSQPRATSCR